MHPAMPLRNIGAPILGGILVAIAGAAARADDSWPRFRGPTGLGYTGERNLPTVWGGEKDENVIWKAPLVGEGHASPIVAGDRVFVCTAHWPPSTKDRAKVQPEHHVLCYDARTGDLLWDTLVPPGPWLRTDFRSGPGGGYACPTPATDGATIYCAFGSSVIAALDFGGKIRWRTEIVPYTFDVTVGSSPVLFKDTVIMLCAMAKPSDSKLVAYDAESGKPRWESPLPRTGFGHSTPVIIEMPGGAQLLCVASGGSDAAEALQSFDPATGRRLWWCAGAGDAASPAFGAAIVYFDSGRGGNGVAVDPTGTGDVTKTHVKWRTAEPLSEAIGSPIIVGDLVYRLQSTRDLVTWNAADGTQVHEESLDDITTTWASPIADPDGVIFFASAGTSYAIKAGRPFKVLARNELGDPNHCSPAVARGRMYLVGQKNVYCIGRK